MEEKKENVLNQITDSVRVVCIVRMLNHFVTIILGVDFFFVLGFRSITTFSVILRVLNPLTMAVGMSAVFGWMLLVVILHYPSKKAHSHSNT